MVNYVFGSVLGQTINFDATQDKLVFDTQSPTGVTVEAGTNFVKFTSGGQTVTLNNVTLANLTTAAGIGADENVNVAFLNGGALVVGDNATGNLGDELANNILIGTPFGVTDRADLVFGLGGADSIRAGEGADIIYGGDGADTIESASADDGADSVFGGQGNDKIDYVTNGNVTADLYLRGGKGDDAVLGGAGSDQLYGDLDNDTITGAAASGEDTVYGGKGNDVINYGAADTKNVLRGDLGDDTITSGSGNDTVLGGQGNDTITNGGNGKSYISGGLGNDNITGGTNAETLHGGVAAGDTGANSEDGDDTIVSGGGNDLIYGAAGNDTITVSAGAVTDKVTVYGGKGDDTIDASAGLGTVVINGNDGADKITGTALNDTIFGGQGADSIYGGLGADLVYGDKGDDVLFVGTGATNGGNDSLYGGEGNDTFNLDLSNAADNNVVIADFGNGSDVINVTTEGASASAFSVANGGSAPVITLGAAAIDTITLANFAGQLTATNFVVGDGSRLLANWNGAAATLTGSTVAGGDQLIAGNNGDTLIGDAGTDVLTGGAGNDVIYGNTTTLNVVDAISDTINAGAGNDIIYGGINDRINGGDGQDTLYVGHGAATLDLVNTIAGNNDIASVETINVHSTTGGAATLAVTIDAAYALSSGASTLTVNASALQAGEDFDFNTADAAFTGKLSITAGAGADDLHGGNGDDTIDGGAGADNVEGGAGNDVLTGGLGADTVDGGTGNDVIYGGAGADTLIGGAGADTIDAGASDGAVDVITYTAGSESTSTAYDVLVNFASGSDTLVWSTGGTDSDSTNAVSGSANSITEVLALYAADTAAQAAMDQIGDVTVITINAGSLSGHKYAIVAGDATAAYASGTDLFIELGAGSTLANTDVVDA